MRIQVAFHVVEQDRVIQIHAVSSLISRPHHTRGKGLGTLAPILGSASSAIM